MNKGTLDTLIFIGSLALGILKFVSEALEQRG